MASSRKARVDDRGTDFNRQLAELPLLDYIPKISPHLHSPRHLAPAAQRFENAYRGKQRAAIAVPTQHGKSTLVEHAIAQLLAKHPGAAIFFATYAQRYSESHSRSIRSLHLQGGGSLVSDFNTIQEWRVPNEGGRDGFLLATSLDGPGTGYPGQIIFIDDPFKNRAEAESADYRDAVWQWFKGVILQRLEPNASVFIVASRWHEDDLSGRVMSQLGWDECRLSAVNDDGCDETRELGAALCPWGPDPEAPRDLAFLEEQRELMGPYDWESLMQGRPKPESGSVFRGLHTFHPANGPEFYREGIGYDLSYTAGAKSDWTVVLRLRVAECLGELVLFVDGMTRMRAALGEVAPVLEGIAEEAPGVQWVAYAAGPEVATITALMLLSDKLHLDHIPARFSKLVRAQQCAKRWNKGNIKLRLNPDGTIPEWHSQFAKEVRGFTGDDDGHDDIVDALVAGHDMLCGSGQGASGLYNRRLKRQSFSLGARRM